jgi:signal transduction histidine kinase
MDPRVMEMGIRPGHWGLPGVRERAHQIGAKLDVRSEPGAGTEVQLNVTASVAYRKDLNRSGTGAA